MAQKIGIAGMGAIGSAVGRALENGIDGLEWAGYSNLSEKIDAPCPHMRFEDLAHECDIIVEALPSDTVPELAQLVFKEQKTLILISSCALLIYPELLDIHKQSTSRICVPSGALAGIDGVKALKEIGIQKSTIASVKHPRGFRNAPYVDKMRIDLDHINTKTRLFTGNALEAAQGFPANVNVAATLSLAGIGPERTQVEIWADPDAQGNSHEFTVEGEFSHIQSHISNLPDPANPKSSVLAAQSIVATLRDLNNAVVIS